MHRLAVVMKDCRHTGFFSGMRNIIDKLYDDDPEQKAEACQRHMEFYNSEFALVGPVILGAAIAMEEEKANGADIDGQAISAIKTSLMGPLAGIGDTLRQGTLDADHRIYRNCTWTGR